MQFFVSKTEGYINGVGTTKNNGNISEDEYNAILSAIKNAPRSAPNGYVYKLKAETLTYELCESPIIIDCENETIPSEEEEATSEDYQKALERLGVEVE